MPACPKCGAFVGEDGKHEPAQELLRTSNERDTAQKAHVELQWVVGGMRGEITKLQADRDVLEGRIKAATEALSRPVDTLQDGTLTDAVWRCDAALKILKGEP